MQEREMTLEVILKYANAANKYARDQIRKGSTQIENNNLSEEYFDYLSKGIMGKKSTGEAGIRDIIQQQTKETLESAPYKDERLAHYESVISTTSKYSVGNCLELAVQALSYILENAPSHVNAEIYKIERGDHAFLVLNRDQSSNPQDPTTWGKNAVICDPWANEVYEAAKYLNNLKNFKQIEKKNCLEDFNKKKHILIPNPNFNANLLRYTKNVDNLRAKFFIEFCALVNVLNNYKNGLIKEQNGLKIKYGANDEKVKIMQYKIDEIEDAIRSIKTKVYYFLKKDFNNDYSSTEKALASEIVKLTVEAMGSIQFSEAHKLELFRSEDIKTDLMKFFGIRSDTQSTLEDLTKDASNQLSKKHK